MAENTKGQGLHNDPSTEDSRSNENTRVNVGNQESAKRNTGSSGMDEKSSTMGRRDKSTGLASKDGVTGSDYDGQ